QASGGNRRCFRRVRDLADDLDDVPVRVPDPALAVGAVAPREDFSDPLELAVGPELARVWLDLLQRPTHELRDRHAVARPPLKVHYRRLEPVAGGEPLVLGGQDSVVRGDLGAYRVPLAVELDERLAEGGQRDRVLHARYRVADANLDRPEARVQTDVPPDVRVVRDAAGLLELADDLGVVGVVAEARRGSRAREGREDHLPARREAGRLAAREGRAGGEREQRREVREQAVDDLDRLLGVVDRDVDVQPKDQLAPGDVLELVDEVPVAVAGGDALALEQRERVRPGRADAHALLGGEARHVGAQLAQL